VKVVIYGEITGQPSRQIVPFFAARIPACFHTWRHLVTKVGTTKILPKLQRVIFVPFLSGLFFMPNWPNECTQTFIRYARISSFSASHVLS